MSKYKYFIAFLLLFITVAIACLAQYQYLHRFDSMIERVAAQYELDPALVRALIYEESYFDQSARSGAGAVGLMQVTSIIAREYTRVTGKERLADAFSGSLTDHSKSELARLNNEELLIHPEINMQLGCWYLDQLMKRYAYLDEPLPMVLASYNAGPSNAIRWQQRAASGPRNRVSTKRFIDQIDYPETKHYVSSVLGRYKKYKENHSDRDMISWLFTFGQ